jgi:hypothetical protein
MASDGDLMWTIGAGGAAAGSAMSMYKDAPSKSDSWRVIRDLETL